MWGAGPGRDCWGLRGRLALGVALVLLGSPAGAAPFEAPTLRASELLPAELLRGPHHTVDEQVGSDGFLPVFTVSSEFGRFEVAGEAALREQIREIEALAALREAGAAETTPAPKPPPAPGGSGLGWGEVPGQGGLVLAGGERGGFRDLDAMKRSVAHRLGIDPHTPNEALQSELRRHVWAAWTGGMASPFAEAPPKPSDVSDVHEPERPDALLRDFSAEDLRRLHRIELAVMGVDEPLREKFLEHPHYTSRHGTRLLDALSGLEDTADRSAFIEAAVAARSADEARGFERMATLLRRYGEQTGSLERFLTVDGRVAAHTTDGTLVVPVLAEHGAWTQGVARLAESLAAASGQDPEVARTRLLVSGSLSERARREMERLGLSVTEKGLGREP
ncbi:MAG: hypothetical protein QNK04_03065 [Myxococcota bacterium]|nr:hypothetical protein [Myxococcota bacterium]